MSVPIFGAWLRQQREQRQITAAALADTLGISPSYLSRIESGQALPPPPIRLYDIAEALDVDPDEVFIAAGRLPPDVDLAEAVRLYRQAHPQGHELTESQAWELAAQNQGFASAQAMFEHMRKQS